MGARPVEGSAIALCGIGASLLYQQRQIRQELAGMDRQQHAEILKLAIDNPELIEVLIGERAGPDGRREVFANLAMMYWLAIWELGEIDEEELRLMVAGMFGSAAMRNWWAWVGDAWIGTRNRPDRVRFLSIISTELVAAEAAAAKSAPAKPHGPAQWPASAAAVSLAAGGLALGVGRCLRGRAARAGGRLAQLVVSETLDRTSLPGTRPVE